MSAKLSLDAWGVGPRTSGVTASPAEGCSSSTSSFSAIPPSSSTSWRTSTAPRRRTARILHAMRGRSSSPTWGRARRRLGTCRCGWDECGGDLLYAHGSSRASSSSEAHRGRLRRHRLGLERRRVAPLQLPAQAVEIREDAGFDNTAAEQLLTKSPDRVAWDKDLHQVGIRSRLRVCRQQIF